MKPKDRMRQYNPRDLIVEAWEQGDYDTALQYIALFHGHPGPNATIGFRAGTLGLRKLGIEKYFGAKAIYRGPLRTPESCFADGLQLGTGATAGKANLIMEDASEITLVVGHEESGEQVAFRVSDKILKEIRDRFSRDVPEPQISRWVLGLKDTELFEVC